MILANEINNLSHANINSGQDHSNVLPLLAQGDPERWTLIRFKFAAYREAAASQDWMDLPLDGFNSRAVNAVSMRGRVTHSYVVHKRLSAHNAPFYQETYHRSYDISAFRQRSLG
jgi:hypothetical protein